MLCRSLSPASLIAAFDRLQSVYNLKKFWLQKSGKNLKPRKYAKKNPSFYPFFVIFGLPFFLDFFGEMLYNF